MLSEGGADDASRRQRALRVLLDRMRSGAPDAAPAGALELSFSQERLWLLDQMRPGGAAYNILDAHRLRGPLDVEALHAALDGVVSRHDVLRATFHGLASGPVQVVAPALAVPLRRLDVAALPPAERAGEARRLLEEEAALPFDLAAGPLLRAVLVRLGPSDHLLLLTLHHIAGDGWSLGVLNRELGALYAGTPLPAPTLQYADFAAEQRRWLRGPSPARELAFWRERLAGAPRVLDLPRDRPRPALQSFRGHDAVLELDIELELLARSLRATPFMVLLAAFGSLLARLAGQEEVLVGVPVAGRPRPELEGLVGCFLNSLVLRVDARGRPSFRELVGRVREAALAAYDHQDLPFESLVEELQPERDLSRTPLFQVFFNHLNVPARPLHLAGLAVAPYEVHNGTAKFDLTLYADERASGLRLRANACADLFDAGRTEELLRQFAGLLELVAAAPDRPAGGHSLVTPVARAALPDPLARLDATWRGSVPALLHARAERTPEAPAVGEWSYGELAMRAGRLARALGEAGVGRGDVVAIHARRAPELVQALLGTLWAGAAFTVLDAAHPPARLAAQAALAGAVAWIDVGPPDPALAAAAAGCRLRVRLPELGEAPPAPPAAVGPDDLAYVAFTSGSTGAPKGILGRHGPLTHFLPWLVREFGLGPGDRFSMLSGLAHDPLHREVFTPLCLGAAIRCPPPDPPGSGPLPAWLGEAGVTVAHLTPALGQLVTEPAPSVTPGCLPELRLAFYVGDALARRDVARLRRLAPAVTVVNYYGSTETQRAVGAHVVHDPETEPEVVPLGRGIEDVQLLVLDEDGALAGVGELGEVHLRSPHLARGYLGDTALTAARFLPAAGGRMYRTGDLGRYRRDGEVEPAGRADRQVKIRGNRVEPAEIEAVLRDHSAVREAAVAPGPAGGLVAYVACETPERDLRDHLRARLPDFMVPAVFVRLDRLPLTPNGKLDHAALPAPGAAPADDHQPPADGLEAELAAVWREVLGDGRRVDRRDSIFDLGGGSLEVIRVHARLRERYGGELTVVDLFRHGSLAALAERLRDSRRGDPGAAGLA